MQNNYLIPANTKRGNLIFGFFRPIDLIVLGSGILISVIMMIVFSKAANNIYAVIGMLVPMAVCSALVFPLPPYYHNGLVVIESIYKFYTKRNSYYWRGWCANVGPKK